MLFGGQGMLPSLMTDNAVDTDAHRVSKTRMQRFDYARRDTEDGPLEIIPPEDLMWYKFNDRNFTSTKMQIQNMMSHFWAAGIFLKRSLPSFEKSLTVITRDSSTGGCSDKYSAQK
jgi:hypothetical protein